MEIFEVNLSLRVLNDILRKRLFELTKSAKISCKAFSLGVTSDLFLDLRGSKIEEMKGIHELKKEMPGSNYVFCAGGRYLKKTSDLVN